MSRDIFIDEDLKMAIQVAIERFVKDDSAIECEFPSSFTSIERAYIHRRCHLIGLISKSRGKGTNRYMTIRKKQPHEVVESPMLFQFGQNSRRVLHSLLHRWPLKQKERQDIQPKLDRQVQGGGNGYRSDANKPSGRLPNGIPQVPIKRSPSDIDDFRTTLPVHDMKEVIVKTIWDNCIVLIRGETGSGKTTQIPQFILDEALKRNEVCRIVCTQPRRISAVATAERVALERGEGVGQTVGYQIRLESRASPRTLLTFCTNGVLLRTLMAGDSAIQSITHIIVDEVHERDRFCDFLLIKLRKLMLSRKPHFRLVLMSAHVDVGLLLDYFAPCPIVEIPGKLYEVEEFYLEDVLCSTAYLNKHLKKLQNEKDKKELQERCLNKWVADAKKSKDLAAKVDEVDVEVEKLTMEDKRLSGMAVNGRGDVQSWMACDLDKAIYDAWHNGEEASFDNIVALITQSNAPVNYRHSDTAVTPLMTSSAHGMLTHVEQLLTSGAEPTMKAPNGLTAFDMARQGGHTEVAALLAAQSGGYTMLKHGKDNKLLSLYEQSFDDDQCIDCDLIMSLLHMICSCSDEGAILIYLPSYDDMVTLCDLITDDCDITVASDIRLFMLHAAMQSTSDMKQVFKPATKDTRKIILATNIAESAVTVDDVVYVIDCGKIAMKVYDDVTSTTLVKYNWISQSNALQRRKRAGRCRPGICYHLYSSCQYMAMSKKQIPYLTCTPLHDLCLQIKLLDDATPICQFLMQAPSPPVVARTESSINLLKTMDALDSFENLTELGQHLVDLPIEPRLGKMILYSVVLKCLDPILTIACSLSHKDPFMLPKDSHKRLQAMESRRKFSAATFSDHMCLLRAFQSWQKARSDGWEKNFCRRNFMSQAAMEMIVGMRSQLLGQLRATGFVRARGGSDIRDLNTNSENWAVVKAALCASIFPNLLRVDRKFRRLTSIDSTKVRFHHSSVLSQPLYGKNRPHEAVLDSLPSDWLIYDEMLRSSSYSGSLSMAQCCTAISSTCVALFAGPAYMSEVEAVTDPENTGMPQGYPPQSDSESDELDVRQMSTFAVTDWIKLTMEPSLAHMIVQLRTKWYSLFARRIRCPSKPWQQEDEAILSTIINVLSSEDQTIGLTQPSGIGQRPRPVTHDDSSRSSHFMPRTPSSGKGDIPTVCAGKKQPKSLNFGNITTNQDQPNETGDSRNSAEKKTQEMKASNSKPNRYFIMTLNNSLELKQAQSSGHLAVSKNVSTIFEKTGKDVDICLFFSVLGIRQLEGFAKLAQPCGNATMEVQWVKQTPLSGALVQLTSSVWNNRMIADGLQEVEQGLGDTLLQLWDLPQTNYVPAAKYL